MKIKILITAIILIISTNIYSQKFNGGLVGGIVASQVDGDAFAGYNKAGLFLGGYTNIDLTPKTLFQMELEFIQKGSRHAPDTLDYRFYKLRLNYLEMPLLLKFKLKNKFSVELGMTIGYLINWSEDADYGAPVTYNPFKKYDFSTLLGVDYLLTDNLHLNLRFTDSFSPIRPHTDGARSWFNSWLNAGQYNNIIIISLQYEIKSKINEK